MKKVFISQPMNGKTKEDILTERNRCINTVAAYIGEPCTVLDSFFQVAPAQARPLWYLGAALQVMSEADVVVFAKGWEDARGCRIEHRCAMDYEIPILEVEEYGILEVEEYGQVREYTFDAHGTVVGKRLDTGLLD